MKTHDDLLHRIRRLQSPQDVSDILEALVSMPGAVRVKSVLRDRIAAMVEDNTTFNITPAEVRDILGDMTDTFLDGPSVQAKDSSIVVDRTTPGVVRAQRGHERGDSDADYLPDAAVRHVYGRYDSDGRLS